MSVNSNRLGAMFETDPTAVQLVVGKNTFVVEITVNDESLSLPNTNLRVAFP